MPSSTLRHLGNQPAQPVIQPAFRPAFQPNDVLISSLSPQALGDTGTLGVGFAGNQTYPAASRVLATPLVLGEPFLVRKVWTLNGSTAGTDSWDIGVYSEDGTTLLVHSGSTLSAGTLQLQEVDVTDTLLVPGRYWMAFIQGGTTAQIVGFTPVVALLRAAGAAQQAGSGSTLGSTFTPAAIASAVFPYFGISSRVQTA